MKKYLIILSAAFLAVTGCMKFEPETTLEKDSVSTPSITVNSVEDTGFTVTIAPATGTGFYSYAVKPGDAAEVSANTIFKLGLSGSMDKGTVNYAEKQTTTLKYEGLDMNATYTVYAVAASELGCIGEVTSTTIHTSDTAIPALDGDPDISGTKVSLTFTEPVTFSGKGVSVKYYAINTKDILSNIPAGIVEDFKVVANGKAVNIDCGSMPNGAYYAVCIEEGAFTDAVGNKCEAIESGFGTNKDGKLASTGIIGRKATVPFALDIYGGTPVTVVTSMSDAIWMSIPEDVVIADFDNSKEGTIEYEYNDGVHSRVDSYIVHGGAPDFGYGWNGNYNCALTYPNAGEYFTGRPDPERGSMVTITIPSFLTDIYGNMNAEFVIGPFLYSFGYKLDDIAGAYTYDAESYFVGPTTSTIVIEESDDAEKGNVMFTTIYGDECDNNVYADFDFDLGVLTIPDWQPIWDEEDGTYYFAINGQDYVTLSMPKSGTLTGPSEWFGYYFQGKNEDDSGWGDIFTTFDAKKSAAAPMSVTARKVRSFGKTIR